MGRGLTEARKTQGKALLVKIPLPEIKVIDEEWCVKGVEVFFSIFLFLRKEKPSLLKLLSDVDTVMLAFGPWAFMKWLLHWQI